MRNRTSKDEIAPAPSAHSDVKSHCTESVRSSSLSVLPVYPSIHLDLRAGRQRTRFANTPLAFNHSMIQPAIIKTRRARATLPASSLLALTQKLEEALEDRSRRRSSRFDSRAGGVRTGPHPWPLGSWTGTASPYWVGGATETGSWIHNVLRPFGRFLYHSLDRITWRGGAIDALE